MGMGMGIAFDHEGVDEVLGDSFWDFTDGKALFDNLWAFDEICEEEGKQTFSDFLQIDEVQAEIKYAKELGVTELNDEQLEKFRSELDERLADPDLPQVFFSCEKMLGSVNLVIAVLQGSDKWQKELGDDLDGLLQCVQEIKRRLEEGKQQAAKAHYYVSE